MSYCRWGEGDLYVWEGKDDGKPIWVCQHCPMRKADSSGCRPDSHFESRQDMLKHLEDHRAFGHKFPERALERLRAEIAKR